MNRMMESIFTYTREQRAQGKKIVLVTGVFDLLHSEHIAFLKAAQKVGDVLLVAIESDVRVRAMKGEDRPINTQEERKKAIECLRIAQKVFILPEDFSTPDSHRWLIHGIHPHVLAVSEHSPHQDKKRQILAEVGGEVKVVLAHNPSISTTKIIKNSS
jgi:rfaE bifunctional protein nucleotidyltransferase chain/domain